MNLKKLISLFFFVLLGALVFGQQVQKNDEKKQTPEKIQVKETKVKGVPKAKENQEKIKKASLQKSKIQHKKMSQAATRTGTIRKLRKKGQ